MLLSLANGKHRSNFENQNESWKKEEHISYKLFKIGLCLPNIFVLLRAIQLVCNYKFFVKRCEVFRYCHMNKAKTHIRHYCFATSCNSLRKINFMNAKRYQISGKDFEFYIVIVERKVNDYLLDCIQCLCDWIYLWFHAKRDKYEGKPWILSKTNIIFSPSNDWRHLKCFTWNKCLK